MHKTVERSISKIRNRSIAEPLISFIVALCVGGFLLGMAIIIIIGNMLLVRFQNIAIEEKSLIKVLEENRANGLSYSDTLADMKKLGFISDDYCVLSKDGEVIFKDGQIPSDAGYPVYNLESKYLIRMMGLNFGIELSDNENPFETIDFDSETFGKLWTFSEITAGVGDVRRATALRYVFWLEYDAVSDNAVIYQKAALELTLNDCMEFMVPIVFLSCIFLIIVISSFVRSLCDMGDKRNYLRILLSDRVTGGNNATFFEYYLHRVIPSRRNRKRGFAVVDITLAKYQNYCTLYGINEGERLLRAIYQVFREQLYRKEIPANADKGNFLILLCTSKKCPTHEALIERIDGIINSIPEKIAEKYTGKNEIFGVNNIRLKAGLYFLPPAVDDDTRKKRLGTDGNIKSICIKASIAKNENTEESGLVIYNHEMWESEIWEQKVENMMHSALEKEEFSVYIQPKYSPVTEELMGGEALVRWISPTEGFISPGQFIPIFERTGFVTKLDDYMISHTAKLQSEWLAAGKKIVPISVNVSRAHFAQPDLAEHIRDLVDQYPLPHQYIEIELTESAFFDDKKALLNTVHKLQEYGFEVSMDDFGAGYSSLNSLKDLPLNVLKLDADFFRGDDFEGRGEIVVSKAIALAKQLNMRIVAEGVEKKDQVDFLASQECDMIQGFYFAKPMPANEYESRMS